MTRRQLISLSILGSLVIGLMALLLVTPLREGIRSYFFTGQRHVLAKVEGEFAFNALEPQIKTRVIVLKIQEDQNLLIEVYRIQDNGEMALWSDFEFENERDSYLTQGEKSSNLSLTDVKKDGIFRIVVPALDSRLNPRVHVLEYNPEINRFMLLKEEDIREVM